ncbi:hypothetical protein EWM64_g9437 [Hericium alpestre]|uniref:Dienelactone hydrolase domain-containing protein n=1 Tax=Hericium alpestre TaxID=135208 RepID=A0A4Y9ZKM6_9AGAM|nr:hypothetical protein EWM64_g9437 [Hericium alpestre]
MPDLCKHCIEGVRHEGTPEGRFEDIGGIRTYSRSPLATTPRTRRPSTSALAIPLTTPGQLLADDFARNGFQVYLPDLFDGDPVPEDAISLNATVSANFGFRAWLARNSFGESLPKVKAVIHALKESGVSRFGAIGFCYGGRHVFDLAYEQKIHVSVASHPSFVQAEDLEIYAQKASAPLLLNTCEVDGQFPAEKQARADEVLGGGKFKYGYERTYWPECTNEFAVRGDLSDPNVKAGKEGSFEASVRWFLEHL